MPKVIGNVTVDGSTTITQFSGIVTNHSQTFYFDDTQNSMVFSTGGNSDLTLKVNSRSYIVKPNSPVEIYEDFSSFNVVRKDKGSQTFDLNAYMFSDDNVITFAPVEDVLTSTNPKSALSANQGRVLKGLVDTNTANIGNKLDITSVIDNLTTPTINVPLSANQGKVLNDKIAETVTYIDASSFGILPDGSGVSDKLKNAIQTLSTKKNVALYFSVEGEYLLDKSILINNDFNIVCKNKKISFKVSSSFALTNDYIIRIVPLDATLLNISFKNFVLKVDGVAGHSLSAVETLMLKVSGVNEFIFDRSEIHVTNSGLALKTTPIDFRVTNVDVPLSITTNNNIMITDCLFRNESGATIGGILWVRETCNNVTIRNCTFFKNGIDEIIAFFRPGTKQNINIHNNNMSYTESATTIDGTNLISFISHAGSSFSNVRFWNNNIKIFHTVSRLFRIDILQDTYKDITIENNYIEYMNTCVNECISVFTVSAQQIGGETNEVMWNRLDLTIRDNTIITNSINQRSILYVANCRIDFISNKVSGVIQQGLVYMDSGVFNKVNIIGNKIEGLKFLATMTSGVTDSAYLFIKDNKIKGVPMTFINGTPKVYFDFLNNHVENTANTTFFNRFATVGGEINMKDNTFIGSGGAILSGDSAYFTDVFLMVNNLFKNLSASQVFGSTIGVNTTKLISGNVYNDGTDDERRTSIPANLQTMYQTGKLVNTITDTSITRNVKKVDGTWTTL